MNVQCQSQKKYSILQQIDLFMGDNEKNLPAFSQILSSVTLHVP